MIHIRKATLEDDEQLIPLVREFVTSFKIKEECIRSSLQGLLLSEDAFLFVAEDNSLLVGYVLAFDHLTFFANGRVTWVEEIMVKESYRRSGIGKDLMIRCEEWAKSRNSRLIALATRRAADFYTALQYENSASYFRKLFPE